MPTFTILSISPTTQIGDILEQIDKKLTLVGSSDPAGAVAARSVGQFYYNSTTKVYWKASATNGTVGGTTWELVVPTTNSQATESTLGIAKIATNALVIGGTDDLTIVTPLKLVTYYLSKAGNLAGLVDLPTSRTNLGLGSMSIQNSSGVSITGGAIDAVTIGGTTPPSSPIFGTTVAVTNSSGSITRTFLSTISSAGTDSKSVDIAQSSSIVGLRFLSDNLLNAGVILEAQRSTYNPSYLSLLPDHSTSPVLIGSRTSISSAYKLQLTGSMYMDTSGGDLIYMAGTNDGPRIRLSNTTALGIQTGGTTTMYSRSVSGFIWYLGGSHNAASHNAGGGSVLGYMELAGVSSAPTHAVLGASASYALGTTTSGAALQMVAGDSILRIHKLSANSSGSVGGIATSSVLQFDLDTAIMTGRVAYPVGETSVAAASSSMTQVSAGYDSQIRKYDSEMFVAKLSQAVTQFITANTSAVFGKKYACNTTAGGFTVSLPTTNMIVGGEIEFNDGLGTWVTNALVIDPGANSIEGGASGDTLICDVAGASFKLRWTGANGWRLV